MGDRGVSSGFKGVSKEERKETAKIKKRKFTEFDDEPRGGYGYDGDGQKQVSFFNNNSNYNELIDEMNEDERSQFNHVWVPGRFMDGEGYRDWGSMRQWAKDAIKVFDKYLDRTVLNKSLTVVRLATAELLLGHGNTVPTSIDQLKALRGQVVVSKGNMSTGVAKEGLTIGSRLTTNPDSSWGKSMEYRIHIPRGSKGAGMWIGDKRINSGFGSDQREFMTNRDIRLRVGRTRYDSKRDVYVTDLTFVGRLDHKYD